MESQEDNTPVVTDVSDADTAEKPKPKRAPRRKTTKTDAVAVAEPVTDEVSAPASENGSHPAEDPAIAAESDGVVEPLRSRLIAPAKRAPRTEPETTSAPAETEAQPPAAESIAAPVEAAPSAAADTTPAVDSPVAPLIEPVAETGVPVAETVATPPPVRPARQSQQSDAQSGQNQRQRRPERDDRRDGRDRGDRRGGSSNGVAADQPRHHDQQRHLRNRGHGDRERNPDVIQRDGPMFNVLDLTQRDLPGLQELARELEVPNYQRYRKPDLIGQILRAQTEAQGYKYGEGVLDIIEDGFGFLRGERYLPGSDDIYVSQSQIRRFGLRTGDKVSGQIRPPKDNEKFHSLLRVEAVNGIDPETARRRPNFDTLTPIFPLEMIDLETLPHIISTRLLNLVAPIGRGQRGLIVSPPKAGKTIILKSIANGITTNCEDIHLMVCLIGERPEEVTDMKRSVDGEVISSTFDEPVEDHTKVAEMALERAKRLVEGGRDVVILLDSITRLARAYNLAVPPSGRTLSGGIDPIALYPPKRFFGAARNIEGGGSLTIVATCLVDTGSRMDDVIYEEFKGTGNMELHLDRKLAERRIYPSIDIQRSGTRREDLLLDENALRQVYTMRRMVSMLGGTEGTELVLGRLAKTQNNAEFLLTLNKDM
jgi:transcription termination factor Rho